MSKTLILKDKTKLIATDSSSIAYMTFVYASAAEMAGAYEKLTDANLDGCTFEGEMYSRIKTLISIEGEGTVSLNLQTIPKPLPEEEALQNLVDKQSAEITELKANQATEEMKDKVEGYDVLVGGV